MEQTNKYKFDLIFLRRFSSLQKSFFPSVLHSSFFLFLAVLVTSGLEQFLAYEVGLISGLFMKVLGDKDWSLFKTATVQSSIVVLSMVLTKSLRVFLTNQLTVRWRKKLCQDLHGLYFTGLRFYRLLMLDPQPLDNLDQRMTSDLTSTTTKFGSILLDLLVTPPTIVYYTYQAYSRAGWIGPTAMFVLFLVSSLANKCLMSPVVNLTAEMEKREGDFRFKHVDIRKNCEALAFQKTEIYELSKANILLALVTKVQSQLFVRKFAIDLSVNLFSYLGAITSYLVIAVPIFSGAYDHMDKSDLAQIISETGFVCMYLQFQLGQLVGISGQVASMAGSTHRVVELIERMKDKDGDSEEDLPSVKVVGREQKEPLLSDDDEDERIPQAFDTKDVLLSAKNLSIFKACSEIPLVNNLDFQVKTNENILVTGPSGCGKTSLFRAIRGLWPHSGRITWNENLRESDVAYLPQRPFFTNGSLREQLEMGGNDKLGGNQSEEHEKDEDERTKQILEVLSVCDLNGVVDRIGGIDNVQDWSSVLSPGEQQRLSWGRILLQRPVLAFLDEATSALSQQMEFTLYSAGLSAGLTLVSCGHRESLRQFHSILLNLEENT